MISKTYCREQGRESAGQSPGATDQRLERIRQLPGVIRGTSGLARTSNLAMLSMNRGCVLALVAHAKLANTFHQTDAVHP